MFHVALFEPEIPPNTGNIMRLCANTGCQLHLIKPLGFRLDDKQLRRAGLDYREFADVALYDSLDELLAKLGSVNVWALTTHGQRRHADAEFTAGDLLLFGPETRGLPKDLLTRLENRCLRIPMRSESRSLNLSNAAAVVIYEAFRQLDFPDLN
ncbi:MAG: tRNA (uridine(34)/cytosine(34)/5-carboxymethylaminomethyluridine(34)-2'-O)-methyltransferase TrmL [Pseudomonadota bacterium]